MKPTTLQKPVTAKRFIGLAAICIALFYVLTLLPIMFFGLSGNPEQNDAFFKAVSNYFAGPISIAVFLGYLVAMDATDSAKKKKYKKIMWYVILAIILFNAIVVSIHQRNTDKEFSDRQACLDNNWYTTRWNYEKCNLLMR